MNVWLSLLFIGLANGIVANSTPELMENPFFWIIVGLMIAGICSEPLWPKPIYLYIILIFIVTMFINFYRVDHGWLIIWSFVFLSFYTRIDNRSYSFAVLVFLLFAIAGTTSNGASMSVALFISSISLYCAWSANQQRQLTNESEIKSETLVYENRLLKRQLIEEEDLVKQAERTRIARDVHDSVGHQLTALGMQLQMAELHGKEENHYLLGARQTARQALDEMRNAVQALEKEEVRGVAMIVRLIRKLEMESQVRVSLTTENGALSKQLSNEQSIALYRFVQEGLTNAMRHAYAKKVDVTLSVYAETSYVAIVKNEATPTALKEGFGLSQLRNRFEALEGQFFARFKEKDFYMKGVFPLEPKTNPDRGRSTDC
ncbi:sensor histidine kinase [Alkalihalobacillus sp. LMS6]|uniref:sensor histidine kinase n=1 Tax=Alkalihalobacillus sp. LMS6 TaxID=2924034 RepID=UPI0020D1699B|nr:sensor histidine kinase [Alkalihalobacillus sp. LMS6]UTR07493.1 sensor histidine kinase [Alkalihalobacillus sp. LMS6]